MAWNPHGAVAVVTGASSGIGKCLVELLLQAEVVVIANGRRGHRFELLAKRFGERIVPVVGDLTEPATRSRIVAAADPLRGGAVDLLVNAAGIGAIGPFADASPQRLRQIMEVNFFAAAELTRALIPSLRRGRTPVICNIGSVLAHCAVPNKSEYCASKFALQGWSNALRAELIDTGIQVTVVSPSTTHSEFFDSLVDTPTPHSSASHGGWAPERVAAATMRAIESRRSELVLSLGGKALVLGSRCCPRVMNHLVTKYA